MARQVINIGTNPNDGTGDALRDAFIKVNSMTNELYQALGNADGDLGFTLDSDGNINITNDLIVDTDVLVVDSTNNRVGIGTASPDATLELNSATSNQAVLKIGRSTNPAITNNLQLGTSLGDSTITAIGTSSVNAALVFQRGTTSATTESMRIDSDGNVTIPNGSLGVGMSSTPAFKLDVRGIGYFYTSGQTTEKTYAAAAGLQLNSQQSDAGSPYKKTSDIVANADTTAPSELRLFTKASADSTPSERMRIDSSGNVSVKGNALLAAGLGYAGDVTSAGAGTIELYDSSTGAMIINGFGAGYLANSGIQFQVDGDEAMRIDNDGNVDVKGGRLRVYESDNTNYAVILTRDVDEGYVNIYGDGILKTSLRGKGDSYFNSGDVLIGKTANDKTTTGVNIGRSGYLSGSSSGTSLFLNRKTSDGTVAEFWRNGSAVGSISVTSSATTYNTSSDYRLKTDLKDFSGTEILSNIKMHDFAWKESGERTYGVMAHELQEVLPQAVTGEKDGEEMQQVDYSKIVPVLVKALQEANERIEYLESKIK